MKKLLFVSLLLIGCGKKEQSIYYCNCSNGYKTHFSSERKVSESLCGDKQKAINDTAKVSVTCKLD